MHHDAPAVSVSRSVLVDYKLYVAVVVVVVVVVVV